jgi:hypothetical protein
MLVKAHNSTRRQAKRCRQTAALVGLVWSTRSNRKSPGLAEFGLQTTALHSAVTWI